MTDERPQDESPDPASDPSTEQFDAQVNDLLAEAESMSAEIAQQVGSTPPPNDQRDQEFFETETDSEQSLERQMALTRDAVDAAAVELGAEPAKPKKKIALPPKKGAPEAPAGGDAGAEREAESKTITLPKRPTGDADDFVTADDLVAGTLEDLPFEVEAAKPRTVEKVLAHVPRESLRRAGAASARAAATTLETLDKPFTWVGYRPRALLGWLALALSVAAVSLYFFAVR